MPKKKKSITIDNADEFDTVPSTGEFSNEYWVQLLKATAQAFQSDWNGSEQWKVNYRLARGDHWSVLTSNTSSWGGSSADDPNDLVTINITGATIRSLLPFLVNRRPKFIVSPRKPDSISQAPIHQSLLNYVWKEFKMQKHLLVAVEDAIVCGHGIIKTGFTINYDESKDPDKTGKLQYDDCIRENYPYIKAISPFKFIWDLEAPDDDLESARWVAEIFFKDPADVINNEKYDETVRNKLRDGEYEPGTVASNLMMARDQTYRGQNLQGDNVLRRKLVLFEVWDKKFQTRKVFIDNVPEPLLEERHPYYDYLDGFPYVMVKYINMPHEPFGMGLPFWIKDQQWELDRIRTMGFQHRRRFNRKYAVWKQGLADNASLEALERGPDGSIIYTKTNPTMVVVPIQDASLPADQYKQEEICKQDIKDLTGADALLTGSNLPDRTTATEVQARTGVANAKIDYFVANIDDFVSEIGGQLMQHMQESMYLPIVVKIVGPQANLYQPVSREDIQGEFDLDLETTTKQRTDPAVEKNELLGLFQNVVVPLAQNGMIQGDMTAAMRTLFEKFNMPFEGMQIIPATASPITNPPMDAGQGMAPPAMPVQQPTAQPIPNGMRGTAYNPTSAVQGGILGGNTNPLGIGT